MFTSLLLLQSLSAFVIQMAGIGSAAVFFLSALPLFVALLINGLLIPGTQVVKARVKGKKRRILLKRHNEISLWTYALGQALPLTTGTQTIVVVCEFFAPLVCRWVFFFALFCLLMSLGTDRRVG
jgi:hypothetical protein